MSADSQYALGFALQVLGMLVIVGSSLLTAWRMSKYDDVTFDQLGAFLKAVGTELRGGFVFQAIGFIVAVAGMVLQAQVQLQ